MTHPSGRRPEPVPDPFPLVVNGEPQPLLRPPARRSQVSCRCDKRDRAAHGGFSCAEVLASAARVDAAAAASWRRYALAAVGALAGVAGAVLLGWALVLGVTAVVSAVTTAAAWLADSWPGLAAVALLLVLLFTGGAKCAGLHCGGCKG